ncbi:hypothetical protein ONS95_013050 [Cadophora gregata]|uniref:uncharacterized protein n=1 Tax=Cadophora gregata TaxID=51156 RepID=UPI0026DC7D15|nr:uncharacterized protein ONS95_013050 [Cadophora gregata]KAK0100961.1 hypothetical protein ONS96_006193 [Cadophora gregata f. sp. sojae]KAK0116013.1 hypothetical protein ONS95_013050 [Cadophora gregata]
MSHTQPLEFSYFSIFLSLSFLQRSHNFKSSWNSKMASHTANPIGKSDTLNDTSASERPRVQSESICTADKHAFATNSSLAGQDPDLHAAQTDPTLDVATVSESDQEDFTTDALETSTPATCYCSDADTLDDQSSSSQSDRESSSLVGQASKTFGQDDRASSCQNDIGEVLTNPKVSYHTSQILDAYFRNNDVIFNFMDSLFEDWANLGRLASEDELWQYLESGAMNTQVAHPSSQESVLSQAKDSNEARQLNVKCDWEGFPSLQHTEHRSSCSPATYSQTNQQSDDLYNNENSLQPETYCPIGQQKSERHYKQDRQPATRLPATQQNGENGGQQTSRIPTIHLSGEPYENEKESQLTYEILESQQYYESFDEPSHQPGPYFSGSRQYEQLVNRDETDLQPSFYVPKNQRYSQFYQDQEFSIALTEHQVQTRSETYRQQIFEEESCIPGDNSSNTDLNTDDPASFYCNEGNDATTVDEEEPEDSALSIEERMAELKKQIAITQASTKATLDKISENEKRIQEIGATLQEKRKRPDKADETEEMPVRKTKTPPYRRPSRRKEPMAKTTKRTKRARTIESPLEFVQYVPEGETCEGNSSEKTSFRHGLGIRFYSPASEAQNSYPLDAADHAQVAGSHFEWVGQPVPQAQETYQPNPFSYALATEGHFESFGQSFPQTQNAEQPNTPSYARHVANQCNDTSPAMNQAQYINVPDVSSTPSQDFQGQDISTSLNQLDDHQHPTGNYGIHAAQDMAANGNPQFPFGFPDTKSLRWNGH